MSNESKRVLAYAAEEAERLAHRHIGTEHLLLGLLREKPSFAVAQLLNEEAVVLERTRENITEWQKKYGGAEDAEGTESVEIHGQAWNLNYVQAHAKTLDKFAGSKREWKPLDVLVESETGRICFDVKPPHDARFKFVPGGWRRDWCLICGWELNVYGGAERSIGYTNGKQWLCVECYEKFFTSKPHGPS